MAIAVRQSAINANANAGTVTCAWGGRTVPGSLLIMAIASMGGSGATLTTPSGWTKIGEKDNSTSVKVALYEIPNAAARTGTESLTLDTSRFAVMALSEYTKVALSSETDGAVVNNSGSSTSASSGSVTTANANDLLVAALAGFNAVFATPPTQSTPTNSFTLEKNQNNNDASAGDVSLGLLDRIVSATLSVSAGVTLANSSPWAGMVQAFKEAIALGGIATDGGVKPTMAAQLSTYLTSNPARIVDAGGVRMFAGQKSTADGNPAQPSLEMTWGGTFRFRWSVKSGTRTLAIDVKNVLGIQPYPTLTVKADPSLGVNSDVVGTATSGTGWQTIGPITVSPSSDGVLWVELHSDIKTNNIKTTRWDNIVAT